MRNPKVSIIMPVYNTGKYLKEAINSVLEQSLTDLELIIVNDGSTDNSEDIALNAAKQDARIKYFRNENSGVSVARNFGLDHSSGEYVYFFDSDDTINHDFISSSFDIAKTSDSDLVVVGEYYCKRFDRVRVLPTCACFWKRSYLNSHPEIRFPVSIQPGEDGLFSHCLILLTEKISFNPEGIYFYRSHPNQNHRKALESQNSSIIFIQAWIKMMEEFYLQNNLLTTQSIEFALYLEHEPFEFRYLGMNLDYEQKKFLNKEITEFYKKIEPNIPLSDLKKLSKPFLKFVSTTQVDEFDQWLKGYVKRKQKWNQVVLTLCKLIPFSNVRRKIRREISEKQKIDNSIYPA